LPPAQELALIRVVESQFSFRHAGQKRSPLPGDKSAEGAFMPT
jgi:hypothetical protein